MSGRMMPRYPVYVPSKGRHSETSALTARLLMRDGVPFHMVVEPQERNAYTSLVGEDRVLVLPFGDVGTSVPARNWIKNHSLSEGHARHWQLDDNIPYIKRRWKGRRIPCRSGVALAAVEDFADRYENAAVVGLNYEMFLPNGKSIPPFSTNVHVYSCFLMLNSLPYRWRGRYNEDTDMCLQVLSGGWCTVLINCFLIFKLRTMTMRGGNTDELYQGDGRLRMARSLERMWPGVVRVDRRWRRPQHVVDWGKFDTPLHLREGVNLSSFPEIDEYGMRLVQVASKIRSEELRRVFEEYEE